MNSRRPLDLYQIVINAMGQTSDINGSPVDAPIAGEGYGPHLFRGGVINTDFGLPRFA